MGVHTNADLHALRVQTSNGQTEKKKENQENRERIRKKTDEQGAK